MTSRTRMEGRSARDRRARRRSSPIDRRLAGFALSILLLLATASASAGTVGLVARACAATTTGLNAQPPLVSLPDGGTADLAAMATWAATRSIDDRAIVVHDLGTGATFEAAPGAESVGVVSFEGGLAQTLGEVLDEPGALVYFVSPAASPPDPALAERFEVLYAQSGTATYVARPVFRLSAPEPGSTAMGAAGGLLLMALARRRSVRSAS